ncbi:hypothetical protein BO78DRAFT_212175 [Aspergillus sclerotiicarbonarius CBS 121057]|uniref:Uncharacterized protein n=1 Tax=Aspergillus sclerotiicarbonarius (strain CBS 121057 / IBT 28362) TaxID=1448318 RepID=A0A319EPY6_ASPSB|nr:hypothetical protein BO78DRAFT_212175 [Aspergillus sclerotiicarbonarius CBS 121057]
MGAARKAAKRKKKKKEKKRKLESGRFWQGARNAAQSVAHSGTASVFGDSSSTRVVSRQPIDARSSPAHDSSHPDLEMAVMTDGRVILSGRVTGHDNMQSFRTSVGILNRPVFTSFIRNQNEVMLPPVRYPPVHLHTTTETFPLSLASARVLARQASKL